MIIIIVIIMVIITVIIIIMVIIIIIIIIVIIIIIIINIKYNFIPMEEETQWPNGGMIAGIISIRLYSIYL